MAERIPVPDSLTGPGFTRAQAEQAGITQGLRRKDVSRPFHGVQATTTPETTIARCRASAVRLKPGRFFTHRTAARLHRHTLPSDDDASVLHVGAVRPADAPHSRGVRGHRLLTRGEAWEVDGLPVPDPAEVFCRLGAELAFEDLVIIADELLNRTALDEQAARDRLLRAVARVRRVGTTRLIRAVRSSRRGSRSPAETRIRLLLDAAGIPPAELNAPIQETGTARHLGAPDFVWRAQRVVVEYEGDQHRTDRGRFRYDIVRYDDLMADGWRVIRATGEHLGGAGRADLVRRVRRALAQAA